MTVAGELGQLLDRPVVDHHPQAGGGDAESGGRSDDPEITGERELTSCPQCRSLDRCDGADRELADGVERSSDEDCGLLVLDVAQVCAGTERRPLPRHHEDPCVTDVGGDPIESVEVLGVERVATLGAVDRAQQDGAGPVGRDHLRILPDGAGDTLLSVSAGATSRLLRLAATVLAGASIVACGGTSADEERDALAEDLEEETDGALDDATARCVADALHEAFGDESFARVLDAAAGDEDDPDVRIQVIDIFSACDALGPIIDDSP